MKNDCHSNFFLLFAQDWKWGIVNMKGIQRDTFLLSC